MNCGCPEDYHMADCPLMSPPDNDPPEDEDWTSMIYGA